MRSLITVTGLVLLVVSPPPVVPVLILCLHRRNQGILIVTRSAV